MENSLEERMQVLEKLTKLFRFERMVYLVVTGLSLVMLITCAISLLIKAKAGPAELTGLFGSSGLITYTASRLLYMWNEALRILFRATSDKEIK